MMTSADIEILVDTLYNKQKMDVMYLTRTQAVSITKRLKSIGQLSNIDGIREVLDDTQEYAMGVIMIQHGFNDKAIKKVRDQSSLFFRRWNKEYIMEKLWEDDDDAHEKWDKLADQYLDIFKKTLKVKLEKKFINKA